MKPFMIDFHLSLSKQKLAKKLLQRNFQWAKTCSKLTIEIENALQVMHLKTVYTSS